MSGGRARAQRRGRCRGWHVLVVEEGVDREEVERASEVRFSVTATAEGYRGAVLAAVVQALTLFFAGSVEAEVAALTPREKAQAVVVAGCRPGRASAACSCGAGTRSCRGRAGSFADQEGGLVKTFSSLPPWRPASSYAGAAEA